MPEGVDCAALAIPRAGILDAVAGCAQRGVGGVIIYAAGFAEAGPDGVALQAEIARIAREHGMAIAGPNCLGHINYVDGIPLTFSACTPVPVAGRRSIGIVSQSGAMATVMRAALHPRDIAISFSISTGNEALNGIEDFLDYLIDDNSTHVLLMMVEQFRHPQRFLALGASRSCRRQADRAAASRPQRRRAPVGQDPYRRHERRLRGHARLVSQAGVAVVDTLEELLDLGELMIRWPSPPRGGAAVISDSGAFKAMVLDFCESSDLDLPEPLDATKSSAGCARARSHPADQSARRHRAVAGRSRSLSQGDEAVPRRRALRQRGARGGAEQSDPQRAQDGADHHGADAISGRPSRWCSP